MPGLHLLWTSCDNFVYTFPWDSFYWETDRDKSGRRLHGNRAISEKSPNSLRKISTDFFLTSWPKIKRLLHGLCVASDRYPCEDSAMLVPYVYDQRAFCHLHHEALRKCRYWQLTGSVNTSQAKCKLGICYRTFKSIC